MLRTREKERTRSRLEAMKRFIDEQLDALSDSDNTTPKRRVHGAIPKPRGRAECEFTLAVEMKVTKNEMTAMRRTVRSSLRANLGKRFTDGELRYTDVNPVTLGVISNDIIEEYPWIQTSFVDAWPIRELISTTIDHRRAIIRRKERTGQSHEATMAVKQLKRLRREVSNSSRESEGDKSEVSQDKTKRIRIQGSDEGEHDSKSDHGRESIVPQRRRAPVTSRPRVAQRSSMRASPVRTRSRTSSGASGWTRKSTNKINRGMINRLAHAYSMISMF